MTCVKVLSSILSIISIKIVSENFSLEQYGTYAQAILIITTVTSLTIMGMTDGINYSFNNQNIVLEERLSSISTLFSLQTFVGLVGGIAIIAGGPILTEYFKNPALSAVYIWIAFQPLLANYLPMLQNLYISIGKTKLIVIRNLIISIFRLVVFILACYVTKSVVFILAACFIFDLIQTIYFGLLLKKYDIHISFKLFQVRLVIPLLKFCIPMAIFVILNSLLRDIDKWVVGWMGNTDQVAIYTNCSRVLPFDMLTASFATILIPVITRNISNDKLRVCQIYQEYLNLSFITTSILILPAIIFSKDLLLALYSPDYLPGLTIFILYLLVDFLRFANLSIIFSASGKSKNLMIIASVCLILNTGFAILLYNLCGFAGPAFATLGIMCISSFLFFKGASSILGANLFILLNFKQIVILFLEIATLTLIGCIIQGYISHLNAVLRFLIAYVPVVGVLFFVNKDLVLQYLKKLNEIK